MSKTFIELATGTDALTAFESEAVDRALEFGADDAYRCIAEVGIVEWLTHDLDEAGRSAALDRLRRTLDGHR